MSRPTSGLMRPFVAAALSLWISLSGAIAQAGHDSEQPCPDPPLPEDKQGLRLEEGAGAAVRLGNFAKIRVPVDLNPSPVKTAVVRSIYIIGDAFNAIEVGWKWDGAGLFATDADTRPTYFALHQANEEPRDALVTEGQGNPNPGWEEPEQFPSKDRPDLDPGFRIRGNPDGNSPGVFRLTRDGLRMRDFTNVNMRQGGYVAAGIEGFAKCESMYAHFHDLEKCRKTDSGCSWERDWTNTRKDPRITDETKWWRLRISPVNPEFWMRHCGELPCEDTPEDSPTPLRSTQSVSCYEEGPCGSPSPPPPPPPPSGSWSDWERHSGGLATGSGLDATSWGSGNLRVVARSPANNIWMKSWDCCGTWSAWTSVSSPSGGITSDPAITASAPNRLHVFARGADNAMWTRYWNGSNWGPWTSLGGGFTSGPDATSINGWVAVFARGTDNAVWKNVRRPDGSWEGWAYLGGSITSDPSAVLAGCCQIHLYARGSDGNLTHQWYDANSNTWYPWTQERVGGIINTAPDASSRSDSRIDVFAGGGGSNELYQASFIGRRSRGWAFLGGAMTGNPGVVSWGPDRIDVFIRGTDNVMYHRWWQ